MIARISADGKRAKRRQRLWRFLSASTVVATGIVLWYALANRPCDSMVLVGMDQASSSQLLELARSDKLVDPVLVADRMRRHPWVRWVEVECHITGTARVVIEERTPELLVLDRYGRGSYYVDAVGFRMPAHPGSLFDVPVLHDYGEPYHPIQPLQNVQVRLLAKTLAGLNAETDALISELTLISDGLQLITTSAAVPNPVEVWLGQDRYEEKLKYLTAFWKQAVISQPEKHFQLIDLRFDSLIVTRESDDV